MACCPTEEKIYGYDDSRFEKDVDVNFHCSICYNVLKEPRTCRNNEHLFCLACITEHLRVNSQTCPECNDHLSIDTLRRARVVNNYLSKLKINCDHASRGCPEFICLEDLETHVANCGYAPVLCSNAECGVVVNKQERVHHETAVCEYRRVKCHGCVQTQQDMGTLKESLTKLNAKVEATTNEMKNNHVEVNKFVGKLEGTLVELNGKVEAVLNHQYGIKQDQQEVSKGIKDVRESLSKVNKNVDEVKVMVIQMLEKFNKLPPSPAEEMLSTPREDILIAGGGRCKKATEIFSWEKNGWFDVSPTNEEHHAASSFIHNEQIFILGGWESKAIETLDPNELPLKWKKYRGNISFSCSNHQTVVYQRRVIHIGGFSRSESSNKISELQLIPFVTMKKLCQMPERRDSHGVEIFEEKVVILGGEDDDRKPLESVLQFDAKKNECTEMVPLPRALTRMATIRWRDKVVVLGGRDENGKVLNDVFMYDCKTGKTTALPSMLEKRKGCCAVITGDTIVVMGGRNGEGSALNSVECFRIGGSTWEYLPRMNNVRSGAIAEVLPCTRKYV